MSRADVFTPAQNDALRAVLAKLREERQSQYAVGLLIDTSQQNVAMLLMGRNGFSYWTASLLVQAAGYSGVDAFFAIKRLSAPIASDVFSAGSKLRRTA